MIADAQAVVPTGSCEQCSKAPATVYAIDPIPGGWGGRYCQSCADRLGFRVVDRLTTTTKEQ